MKEDLLPYTKIPTSELRQLLARELDHQGCFENDALADVIATAQLELEGTFMLHSKTAAKNGGDYDFDFVCVVEGDRFPRFVEHRFNYKGNDAVEKTKAKKARSPWWNLPQVAVGAMGNQIGSITDLMTQCTAAGREDLHRELVEQLQNALDQLKHGVTPDQEKIRSIRDAIKQTPAAQWLRAKKVRSVKDLPEHIECPPSDRIGAMYNLVRKELTDFFTNRMPVGQFRGLVQGYDFSQGMVDDCRKLNKLGPSRFRLVSRGSRCCLGQFSKLKRRSSWVRFATGNSKFPDRGKSLGLHSRQSPFDNQPVLVQGSQFVGAVIPGHAGIN